jgi:hypothetical protein
MAEDNQKDLSIDDEQSEEVAGGAKAEAALRERIVAEPMASEVESELG